MARSGEPVALDRAQPLSFTLRDGRSIAGPFQRWDDETLTGTPGEFRWTDLTPTEAYRIRVRLIDGLGASREARRDRLLDLAAFLWSLDDGERMARRASSDAEALGADATALKAAQERGAALRAERASREAMAAAARLVERSPEAGPFAAGPWPALPPAEAAERLTMVKRQLAERLALSGREMLAAEGEDVIVASDKGLDHAAAISVDADAFVRETLGRLGEPPLARPFFGKLPIVVFEDVDRHRLFQAAAFRQTAASSVPGIVHYDGPRATVVLLLGSDVLRNAVEVRRGVVRAVLHRVISPVRLPPWLHEGTVDCLAGVDPRREQLGRVLDAELRPVALRFLRGGGSLEQVLALRYDGEGAAAWPGSARDGGVLVARAVGYLLANFLVERDTAAFVRLIRLVKEGTEFPAALRQTYGWTEAQLLEAARRHFRFND